MNKTKYLSAGIWIGKIYNSPEKENWPDITRNMIGKLEKKKGIIESEINGKLGESKFEAEIIPFIETDLNLSISVNNHEIPCEGYLRIKPCVIHDGPQFSKLWFILNEYEEISGSSVFEFFKKAEKMSKPVLEILIDIMKDTLKEEFNDYEIRNIKETYDVIFKVAGSYSKEYNRVMEESRSLKNLIELITNPKFPLEQEYYLDLQAFTTENHNIKSLLDVLGISNKKDFQWRHREAKTHPSYNIENDEEWVGYYAVFNDKKNNNLELTGFVGGEKPEDIQKHIFKFPTAIVNESIDVL